MLSILKALSIFILKVDLGIIMLLGSKLYDCSTVDIKSLSMSLGFSLCV